MQRSLLVIIFCHLSVVEESSCLFFIPALFLAFLQIHSYMKLMFTELILPLVCHNYSGTTRAHPCAGCSHDATRLHNCYSPPFWVSKLKDGKVCCVVGSSSEYCKGSGVSHFSEGPKRRRCIAAVNWRKVKTKHLFMAFCLWPSLPQRTITLCVLSMHSIHFRLAERALKQVGKWCCEIQEYQGNWRETAKNADVQRCCYTIITTNWCWQPNSACTMCSGVYLAWDGGGTVCLFCLLKLRTQSTGTALGMLQWCYNLPYVVVYPVP